MGCARRGRPAEVGAPRVERLGRQHLGRERRGQTVHDGLRARRVAGGEGCSPEAVAQRSHEHGLVRALDERAQPTVGGFQVARLDGLPYGEAPERIVCGAGHARQRRRAERVGERRSLGGAPAQLRHPAGGAVERAPPLRREVARQREKAQRVVRVGRAEQRAQSAVVGVRRLDGGEKCRHHAVGVSVAPRRARRVEVLAVEERVQQNGGRVRRQPSGHRRIRRHVRGPGRARVVEMGRGSPRGRPLPGQAWTGRTRRRTAAAGAPTRGRRPEPRRPALRRRGRRRRASERA